MKKITFIMAGLCLMQMLVCTSGCQQRQGSNAAGIPTSVLDDLYKKFPQAEIEKWTREEEGDSVIYDIEFQMNGEKFEADIIEGGPIHNWERVISTSDLPETVGAAVERRFPQSTVKLVMLITAIIDGVDTLEGYEIIIDTANGQEVELMVDPEGAILEEMVIEG